MKLLSWNVNGIRAAERNGFLDWFHSVEPDVLCVQETKAREEQCSDDVKQPKGYQSYWFSAEKAGYSGVAIYTKKKPDDVVYGIKKKEFDSEGRVLQLVFPNFVLINAYFPNSQRDHARLDYKLRFCDEILKLCKRWQKKGMNIVLAGDYNIAHKAIDLKNPKSNENNAGFLPEERSWMDKFIDQAGFIDTFREFEKGPGHYTWWSYRPGVRARNVGWRIDYFSVNPEFRDQLVSAHHHPNVMGSDHCPIELKIRA